MIPLKVFLMKGSISMSVLMVRAPSSVETDVSESSEKESESPESIVEDVSVTVKVEVSCCCSVTSLLTESSLVVLKETSEADSPRK